MGNYQYGILDWRFLLDADGNQSDPKIVDTTQKFWEFSWVMNPIR